MASSIAPSYSPSTSPSTSPSPSFGGYDCDFVESPPDELLCLICLLVAREPMQMDCCGRVYCTACLNEHKKHSYKCPQCREEGTSFIDQKSWREVGALKVKCDNLKNGCNWTASLCDIPNHQQICPFEKIPCKYSEIGCKDRPLRKGLIKHEKDDKLHLSLAMKTILKGDIVGEAQTRLLLKTQAHLSKLESNHKTLHSQLISAQTQIDDQLVHVHTANSKTTFKMSGFRQKYWSGKEFNSPPFYTHQGGYKMCIQAYANGNGAGKAGKGTHVSMYAYLMRGKNDDSLTWPFTGTVTVQLLNQLEDKQHHQLPISYPEGKDADYNRRVVVGEMSNGYGHPQFISHKALNHNPATNCQYLKYDCLYFRVSATNPKPWLTCTM